MNITIERFASGPCSLEQFADRHALQMVVSERSSRWSTADTRYYAAFKNVEIGGDGLLRGAFGNGTTPEAAVSDYAKQIAGQHLVYGAYTSERRTFDAPNELTTNAC